MSTQRFFISFTVLILLNTSCLLGQDSEKFTEKRNELNIGFFNAFQLTNIGDFGFGYKRHFEKGAFRSVIAFSFTDRKTSYDTQTSKTESSYIQPRIGYEWVQRFRRLELFYGSDVYYEYARSRDLSSYWDGVNFQENEYINKTNSYGIRPMLGLRVFINKSISLSTESFVQLRYSKKSRESDGNSTNNYEEKTTSFQMGPLGVVSINFHL
jgi:hypothetical protein